MSAKYSAGLLPTCAMSREESRKYNKVLPNAIELNKSPKLVNDNMFLVFIWKNCIPYNSSVFATSNKIKPMIAVVLITVLAFDTRPVYIMTTPHTAENIIAFIVLNRSYSF